MQCDANHQKGQTGDCPASFKCKALKKGIIAVCCPEVASPPSFKGGMCPTLQRNPFLKCVLAETGKRGALLDCGSIFTFNVTFSNCTVIVAKPGTCPSVTADASEGRPSLCTDRCSEDSDCEDEKKCCRDSCGRTCVYPSGESSSYRPRKRQRKKYDSKVMDFSLHECDMFNSLNDLLSFAENR